MPRKKTRPNPAPDPLATSPSMVAAAEALAVVMTAPSLMPELKEKQGPEMREVAGAAEVVTFAPDDAVVWAFADDIDTSEIPKGAFVRLAPPEDVDEAKLERLRTELAKVATVVVLPRRRAAVVVAPREKRLHQNARQVIQLMVAEANVEDGEALATLTEEVMEANGI